MSEKTKMGNPRVLIISSAKQWPWHASYVLSKEAKAKVEIESDFESAVNDIKESIQQQEVYDITMLSVDLVHGLQLIREIKRLLPNTYVIATSQLGDWVIAREAFRSGASDFLIESVQAQELLHALDRWRSRSHYTQTSTSVSSLPDCERSMQNDKTYNPMH